MRLKTRTPKARKGKFFAWDPQELAELLPDPRTREMFSLRFGVTDAGNFEHGKTVLFLANSVEEIAKRLGVSVDQVEQELEGSQQKIFEARSKRVPPATDIKVLASWNGLMISGLCCAAQLLREEGFASEASHALDLATRAFRLVVEKMVSGQDGKLSSTFQGGSPKLNGLPRRLCVHGFSRARFGACFQ